MKRRTFAVRLQDGEKYLNVTPEVQRVVEAMHVKEGWVHVRVKHTTCSLVLNEDEAGFVQDLLDRLERVAPKSQKQYAMGGLNYYRHDDFSLRFQNKDEATEERVNGHAHVRASFLSKSCLIEVVNGRLDLGTYEQILFIDHDDDPRGRRERTISVSVI